MTARIVTALLLLCALVGVPTTAASAADAPTDARPPQAERGAAARETWTGMRFARQWAAAAREGRWDWIRANSLTSTMPGSKVNIPYVREYVHRLDGDFYASSCTSWRKLPAMRECFVGLDGRLKVRAVAPGKLVAVQYLIAD